MTKVNIDQLSDAKTIAYWDNAHELQDIVVTLPNMRKVNVLSRMQPLSV